MTTNGEFLKSKIESMCIYSRSILARLGTDDLSGRLDQLEKAPIEWLVTHIVSDVIPYASNIPAYVLRMCAESDIDAKKLNQDELDKLARYIQCFIDVVNS